MSFAQRQSQPADAFTVLAALATTHLAVWLIVASARFALGGRLDATDAILALFMALAVCVWTTHSQHGGSMRFTATVGIGGLLAMWAVALVYARLCDDLSYDGQTYQSLAVLQLREGWNPFYSLLTPDVSPRVWVNHYPKGPWIWAAGIGSMFESFQAGKATNVVLAIAAGLSVAGVASSVVRARTGTCLVLGALAAANPIAAVQLATLYVDGQVAALTTVMAAGALTWIARRSALGLLMACSAAICLTNVKFTGAVYAGLFASTVLALSLFRGRWLLGALPLLACVFGLLGPGYSPYVTNLRNGDHILHPVMGSRRLDIMGKVTPLALEGRSRFGKLAISLASETANACQTCDPARLKVPFTVHLSEVRAATFPDPRTGGFGPLFSAALLLSAVLLILAVRTKSVSATLIASLAVLIASVLINPEAWWARYVPQLWLVPLTICLFLLPSGLSPVARWIRLALLVVLIANACFMAVIGSGYALWSTHKTRAQVASLARAGPVHVGDTIWVGTVQRLREGGVTFAPHDARCRETVTVLRSELDVCLVDDR